MRFILVQSFIIRLECGSQRPRFLHEVNSNVHLGVLDKSWSVCSNEENVRACLLHARPSSWSSLGCSCLSMKGFHRSTLFRPDVALDSQLVLSRISHNFCRASHHWKVVYCERLHLPIIDSSDFWSSAVLLYHCWNWIIYSSRTRTAFATRFLPICAWALCQTRLPFATLYAVTWFSSPSFILAAVPLYTVTADLPPPATMLLPQMLRTCFVTQGKCKNQVRQQRNGNDIVELIIVLLKSGSKAGESSHDWLLVFVNDRLHVDRICHILPST